MRDENKEKRFVRMKKNGVKYTRVYTHKEGRKKNQKGRTDFVT